MNNKKKQCNACGGTGIGRVVGPYREAANIAATEVIMTNARWTTRIKQAWRLVKSLGGNKVISAFGHFIVGCTTIVCALFIAYAIYFVLFPMPYRVGRWIANDVFSAGWDASVFQNSSRFIAMWLIGVTIFIGPILSKNIGREVIVNLSAKYVNRKHR